MELDTTQFALAVGIVMALIEIIKIFISKYFGLEKQVSNHIQHKLDEMKECEAGNADRIIKAINDSGIKQIEILSRIDGRLSK